MAHYEELSRDFQFFPIAAETLGAWGPSGWKFIKDLGQGISMATGQRQSTFFLFQSLGMEVQKGNASSLIGTLDSSKKLEELFYL